MGVFGFFACIAWTGFIILCWILYCLVYKGLKYLVVSYISWVKTRNMYVRVKNQQENTEGNEKNTESATEKNEEIEEISVEDKAYEEKPIFTEDIDGDYKAENIDDKEEKFNE